MTEKIIILDFGSQYTQLIARNLRELEVYCEIQPFYKPIANEATIKGVILSGSPFSCNDANSPQVDVPYLLEHYPVLGICFGAQYTAKLLGGVVNKSSQREYGRAQLDILQSEALILQGISDHSTVWMSHADSIYTLPEGAEVIANTQDIPVAAYQYLSASHPFYGLQFHPEVSHSKEGKSIINNFVTHICGCHHQWTPAAFVEQSIAEIKEQVGDQKVLMALSGGVDSTVAAGLIHRAIGQNLVCVFVDNGLLRHGEFDSVMHSYKDFGFNVIGVDAKQKFYDDLLGVTDPEAKRKIIGGDFIKVFDEEAKRLTDISFLGQGTIYPDVIESVSVAGPSATIKSHHNVGGLPETMKLKLVEPLRFLFKDEVRKVGRELGIDPEIVGRHPFPGPGLGIRVLGEVTKEKVEMLQKADYIYIQALKTSGWYDKVWQAGAILLPVQSVGVMGDERTYEFTIALRAVQSTDGMTADWVHLPYDLLAKISNEIINAVRGINRVVYDISSKPPATIEWE